RHAVWGALGLGAVFSLVDLWQVTVLHSGYLTARDVGALLGMYLAGAVVGVLVLLAPWRGRVPIVLAMLYAAGGFLVLEEVALRPLSPLSSSRPWLVAGLALLACLAIAP